MGSVTCKVKKTGKPKYFACWVVIRDATVDLTKSVAQPVPLADGDYELLWELKGEIGEGAALEVWVDGALAAQRAETLIVSGNRTGSGSRPDAPGYDPLRFRVGGAHG